MEIPSNEASAFSFDVLRVIGHRSDVGAGAGSSVTRALSGTNAIRGVTLKVEWTERLETLAALTGL